MSRVGGDSGACGYEVVGGGKYLVSRGLTRREATEEKKKRSKYIGQLATSKRQMLTLTR